MSDLSSASPDVPDLPSLGLRTTLPRVRVLDVFRRSATRHLSADEVYRELVSVGESVSLSTVYKVLAQFEQVGVLSRSELGQSHTVFELIDPTSQRHGHLLCITSGDVTELHLPDLEHTLRELAQAHGMNLTHWALTVWGRPLANDQ